MKIAMVTDSYLPRCGGIELQIHDLSRELAGAGHPVHVVSPFAGGADEGAVRVERLPVSVLPRVGIAWTPMAVYRLERLLREGAFDVVHHHLSVCSPLAFASLCLCHRLGIPVVATFHSVMHGYEAALAWGDRLSRRAGRALTLSAVSRAVAAGVSRAVGGREVHVLPNGIDPGFWRVSPARRAPDEVRIVSVMRLARRKRPRALVEMVARAREHLPAEVRLRVQVAGEGAERAGVERRLRELGLEDTVQLLGQRTREEIRELFAGADLFVLPSVEEAFGIAALEARTAGLPVVAMGSGGVTDVIRDGVEGLLAGTDAEMVERVVRLVRDPALRESIARHNRATPPASQWGEVVARHLQLYQRARTA